MHFFRKSCAIEPVSASLEENKGTMKNAAIIAMLFLLSAACRQDRAAEAYPYKHSGYAEESIEAPRSAEAPPPPDVGDGQPEGRSDLAEAVKPRIIRNADMSCRVEDYAKARATLADIAKRYQATVAHEAERRSSYRIENSLTIRLAPERLDSFILAVEKIALHVESKNVDSRDVTREFVDMETRLAAKRATLERYREILRSAKTVTDILAVEQQMRALIEEIESVEGQLRYLRDQVQLSTMNLTIYQEFDRPDVARPSFWNRVGRNFSEGWYGFLDFLAGVVYLWPLWLVLGIVSGWWIRRRRRRRA